MDVEIFQKVSSRKVLKVIIEYVLSLCLSYFYFGNYKAQIVSFLSSAGEKSPKCALVFRIAEWIISFPLGTDLEGGFES